MSNAKPKTLKLDQIRIDGGTQIRTALNEATVAEYCEGYQEARDLPPVKVVWDGTHYWLWEGFHRWHARKRAGLADIKVESQDGTQRDAILLACGANSEHGLKRSNADKRKAVETLLADKEWGKKSDRWVADACSVSHEFVRQLRASTVNIDSSKSKEGKDGKTRKAPEKKAEPSKKGQVSAFFDGDKAKPEVREFKDTFDVAAIESAPSIVLDSAGQSVPKQLSKKQELAPLLQSWATKLERLRTELNDFSGQEGAEFLEQEIAAALDCLKEVKDTVRGCMFSCECPRCRGSVKADCDRCDGHGYLPESRKNTLSKDDQAYLSGKAS